MAMTVGGCPISIVAVYLGTAGPMMTAWYGKSAKQGFRNAGGWFQIHTATPGTRHFRAAVSTVSLGFVLAWIDVGLFSAFAGAVCGLVSGVTTMVMFGSDATVWFPVVWLGGVFIEVLAVFDLAVN